jgi:hypothetical protein
MLNTAQQLRACDHVAKLAHDHKSLVFDVLTQLAQFWIEGGSQFVAAGLTDQDVKWLRGADLGM